MPAPRLIDRLDAAAERTGIPRLVLGKARRRPLRWWSVTAIGIATIGMGLGLVRPELSQAGFSLLMLGFAVAAMLPLLGPLKPWGSPEHADEFDRAVRHRAFFAAFASISVAAGIGIWLLAGLALLQRWPAITLIAELVALSFYLLVLYSAVPTLHASWSVPPIEEE